MATVNITATFCNSNTGEHASVTLKVNNAAQGTFPLTFSEVQAAVTEEDKATWCRLMCKLHLIGKTPAQLRTDMIAGFSSTV